ncbi:MAG: protein-(glutamine-N5) methyltransferase, release factor-specific [Magnetovibrio sp.]|nr:protein-(glutamine-N5) methyltransferase, release factor-specific [Magnetovibrio sp.]
MDKSIRKAQAIIVRRLESCGIEMPHLDTRVLITHILNRDPGWIIGNPEAKLSKRQWRHLDLLAERREQREPIAYILGKREFWDSEFLVDSATLIPRPDSEILVQAALDVLPQFESFQILDLGTGTGCLLLSLLGECVDANGLGVDNSAAALKIAQINSERLELSDRAVFRKSDWFSELNADEDGPFDIIITNPPYVKDSEIDVLAPEITNYEPEAAIRGGTDGLNAYRQIFPNVRCFLRPGGFFLGEVGVGQLDSVTALAQREGFTIIKALNDLADLPRCVVVGMPQN